MPTTEEMNRVIDSYMGIIDVPVFTTFPVAVVGYHESWDKLMSVVELVEAEYFTNSVFDITGISFVIQNSHVCVKIWQRHRQDGVIYQTQYGKTPESKIYECHLAAYEAIVWLKNKEG